MEAQTKQATEYCYTPTVIAKCTVVKDVMKPGRRKLTSEVLEPCAVKAARTVLRGRGDSNVALLPGELCSALL